MSAVSQSHHLQTAKLPLRTLPEMEVFGSYRSPGPTGIFFFTFQVNKAVSSVLRNGPQNRLFCKITQPNYFQPAERENPFLATFNFLTLFPLSFPNLHPHIWNVILMCSPLSLPERLLASAKTLNPAPALTGTAGWKARGSRGKGVGALLGLPMP